MREEWIEGLSRTIRLFSFVVCVYVSLQQPIYVIKSTEHACAQKYGPSGWSVGRLQSISHMSYMRNITASVRRTVNGREFLF